MFCSLYWSHIIYIAGVSYESEVMSDNTDTIQIQLYGNSKGDATVKYVTIDM